jgi:hypothetical protein
MHGLVTAAAARNDRDFALNRCVFSNYEIRIEASGDETRKSGFKAAHRFMNNVLR